jgi:class 3 adenylate cyclase
MMWFADLVDDNRLDEVLDDRVEQLRETVRYMENQEINGSKTAGSAFVAGFGAVVAQAAAEYIESHRHMLTAERAQSVNEDLLADCPFAANG